MGQRPLRFELFIAARYLRAKRRQAVISVITAISVVGVAAGVAALVLALGMSNGSRQYLQEQLLGSTAHVDLLRVQSDGIRDWQQLLNNMEKQPHVKAGAPAIFEQVLISRGARAKGAILKGVIPSYENRVTGLLKTVKFGSAEELSKEPPTNIAADAPQSPSSVEGAEQRVAAMPPIVLGKDLADSIGATVGSVVLVTSPQGELTPFGIVPKYVRFRVVGIFESGFYDYDTSWAFTRLHDAQRLFGLGDLVSVLEFKIDDIYKAADVGQELEQVAGQGFMTSNWMEQNRAVFRAMKMERLAMAIGTGLIVLVAALNILISLIMMVMEKTRDIAVLMSMGARKAQVRRIFVAQGVLIGLIGTGLGLVAGYVLAFVFDRFKVFKLPAEVYTLDYVRFSPHVMDGVVVALVAIAISLVATLYPSWSAASILPAQALRYE
jgi:lipoprotein-releasing system permease protein